MKKAELKRLEFGLIDMKLAAKDRIREILLWQKIKTDLTDNNDFDTDNFEKHHLETYKKRWELEKNIAIQTNNATVYKNSISNLNTLLEDMKDEKQYERVLLEWSKKLSSSKWNKKLLAIAIMTKCPLDYINAMKVFPDG